MKFVRQNRKQKKRVGDAWRRPRGIDNKLRVGKGWAGAMPKIGYRGARKDRDRHPCGAFEAIVCNVPDLKKAGKGFVVRISGTVGAKKRADILKAAKEAGVRVLNR